MITKEKINSFANELQRKLQLEGHTVQSISYTGHATEVFVSIIADNLEDKYCIYVDAFGRIVWLRVIDPFGYAV